MEEKFSLSQALGLTKGEASLKIKKNQLIREESARQLDAIVKETIRLMTPEKRLLIEKSFKKDLLNPPEFPIDRGSY